MGLRCEMTIITLGRDNKSQFSINQSRNSNGIFYFNYEFFQVKLEKKDVSFKIFFFQFSINQSRNSNGIFLL